MSRSHLRPTGRFKRSTVDPGTRLLLMEGARPPATGHVVDGGTRVRPHRPDARPSRACDDGVGHPREPTCGSCRARPTRRGPASHQPTVPRQLLADVRMETRDPPTALSVLGQSRSARSPHVVAQPPDPHSASPRSSSSATWAWIRSPVASAEGWARRTRCVVVTPAAPNRATMKQLDGTAFSVGLGRADHSGHCADLRRPRPPDRPSPRRPQPWRRPPRGAGSATPASAGAAKTALGTDRYVPWEQVPTTLDAIDAARAAGFEIVALELTDDATPLHEQAPAAAICRVPRTDETRFSRGDRRRAGCRPRATCADHAGRRQEPVSALSRWRRFPAPWRLLSSMHSALLLAS